MLGRRGDFRPGEFEAGINFTLNKDQRKSIRLDEKRFLFIFIAKVAGKKQRLFNNVELSPWLTVA